MKAVKCPVCDGSGYRLPPGHVTYLESAGQRVLEDCPGCKGKCWVEVSEDRRHPDHHYTLRDGVLLTPIPDPVPSDPPRCDGEVREDRPQPGHTAVLHCALIDGECQYYKENCSGCRKAPDVRF